ncbi:MAG: glycogen debranching enzyme family protein [Deltaproteobacteria bacterium]|nr:glycogen debranching enzyme family protein [Deltaproteobacteria bacterium]
MDFIYTRDECLNLEKSLRCEWLETNGLGGYASSTILNCHTRKYHGLLVAPVKESNEKYVFLSKLEPSLRAGDKVFDLSTNKYPEVYHPTGHKYIDGFTSNYYPNIRYHIGDIQFEQSIMMLQGENTVLVRFKLVSAARPVILHLRPLLAFREIHKLTRDNIGIRVKTYVHDGFYKIDPYDGIPPLYFDTSETTSFYSGPYWHHNIEYLKERSRGLEYQEDLFCPGVLERKMETSDTLYFRASLSAPRVDCEKLWQHEYKNRQEKRKKYAQDPYPLNVLKERAGQFIIKNAQNMTSVTAGYPWFKEWGRDAMIAVPGVAFCCDRDKEGFEVLKTFAGKIKKGLIPNYIDVSGKASAYNSIDASLWFFWAVQKYLKKTGDVSGVTSHLFEPLRQILDAFLTGGVRDVSLHDNGLLWAGNEGTQLTWMDAAVHGRPVTPRHGYAVDLNALWFNALSFFNRLSLDLEIKTHTNLLEIIKKCKKAFNEVFWLDDAKYLADCVNDKGQDRSIRPNQIFAVSLPFSPLSREQKRKVVVCVRDHLLTPCGLRTLSPTDFRYCAVYAGSMEQRDSAYHQGTVWPWLFGHYAEARVKTSSNKERTRKVLLDRMIPQLQIHLREACVGGISEIFNGNPPHDPKGCFHQAWSVGEVIRAYHILTCEDDL